MIDPLSQVLGSVRLTGGVFLEARFTAPWCTISHVTPDDIRAFIETPGQIIAQIAHAVGYESEATFNRAFKREFGEPPARWCERQSNA